MQIGNLKRSSHPFLFPNFPPYCIVHKRNFISLLMTERVAEVVKLKQAIEDADVNTTISKAGDLALTSSQKKTSISKRVGKVMPLEFYIHQRHIYIYNSQDILFIHVASRRNMTSTPFRQVIKNHHHFRETPFPLCCNCYF